MVFSCPRRGRVAASSCTTAIPVIQIAEVGVDVHRRIELRTLGNGDENLKTDLTGGNVALLPRLAGSSCWLS